MTEHEIMTVRHSQNPTAALAIKRVIDVSLAISALVVLSPLLSLTALAVYASMGTPVLFRNPRGGHGGKIFTLMKFRTMRDSIGPDGKPLPDEQRLTRLGNFLRRTSIDELPSLWNVVRGEMSLVGPRPLLANYLSLYNVEQARRHEVTPGLTGWAQVNGRNAVSWEEKFKLDVWYVDHWSLWLDVKILLLTVVTVIKREGISQKGQATAELFQGTKTLR